MKMTRRNWVMRSVSGIAYSSARVLHAQSPRFEEPPLTIAIWYGERQRFGHRGMPQPWVNVLGSVSPPHRVVQIRYSLNGGKEQPLNKGCDLHRLASPGDFNVELDYRNLRAGDNKLQIRAADGDGRIAEASMVVEFFPDQRWPLPYSVDFSKLKNLRNLQDACQIVDGEWKLTTEGVRPVVPYYDRVLAFGDLNWSNYSATAEVIFHGFPGPKPGAPSYNVNHAGLTFRFRGHQDDGKQPRVRWYPLGAATEFTLREDLSLCRWRILPGPPRSNTPAKQPFRIELGKRYFLKGEVESLRDGRNRYRDKIWASGAPEPQEWAVEAMEDPYGDFQSGCALLIAHMSDTTFCNVRFEAL